MNRLSIVLCVLKIVSVFSQSCEFISKEVQVSYNESENSPQPEKWSVASLEGCITNTSFPIEKVGAVAINCPVSLPVMEKYFINNMEHLTFFYINECHVEIIEPGAFFNLPNLKNINIRKNALKTISSGVFSSLPSLEILYIYDSHVADIEDHAFANLPKLKTFFMAINEISYIRREWFTNTTQIREFVMQQCQIRKIPAGMFHGWKELNYLDLSDNLISTIEGELIKDNAPNMNILRLHHNRLRRLTANTFSNSIFINKLEISGNLLNYLPEDFLTTILVADITIFANPFTCPCLEKINRIFNQRGVTVNNLLATSTSSCQNPEVPVCGNSLNVTNVCVESIDRNLTRKIMTHMKEIRYDTVFNDRGQQCAMFDDNDQVDDPVEEPVDDSAVDPVMTQRNLPAGAGFVKTAVSYQILFLFLIVIKYI